MADETYTSGAITFSGLGNGTDFAELIDGLVDAEMVRVTQLEKWRASWETKNEQFQELNTQMLSLKSTLEGMDSLNEFISKDVSTTDSTRLTATASSTAQEASHTIEIGQLATNDVLITSSGVADLYDSITSSDTSFTFSYAGESFTIDNIAAGTTLDSFVRTINNHADSRGKIRASTIYDGSTYHLQITGEDQGSDNQVIISNTGTMVFSASSFNQTQDAANAQIRVNGFPSSAGGWIERDSNTINDVIEGLTLDLKDAEVGADIKVNVTTNTASIKENIYAFVDAVNEIRAQIISITAVDDEGEGSILTGNYGIDMVSQNLKNITAEMGRGFSVWDPDTLLGDKYTSLSQLGIMTNADDGSPMKGLLEINEEELDEALEKDPLAVAELFSAKNIGESQSPDFSYTSMVDGTTQPGVYDIEITSDGSGITSATINGVAAKISGWSVTGLSGDALGLALELDSHSAGTYSGTVSIKQGKTSEMVEELEALTKPYNEYTYEGGPLAVLQDNYNDIMDSIDSKIDYEKTRIEKMERTMKLKYARLDALLGEYELQQSSLESAMSQLE